MKSKPLSHLVFYDGECGFCDFMVQFLLQMDKKKLFAFAPLQGKTAEKFLNTLPKEQKNADSLVLVEDFKGEKPAVYLYGKAVLRILWLLGGFWAIAGSLNFLPASLYDPGYRFFAKHRKKLYDNSCIIPDRKDSGRFLD